MPFRHLPIIGLALLAFVSPSLGDGLKEGDSFPPLDRFGLEGPVPSLKGKVVVVDVWATWCAPCRQSFPAFERLIQHFGSDRLAIIAVSEDDSAADLKRLLTAHQPGFATPRDAKKSLAAAVKPPGMPTSYVLDRAGIVRLVHVGFHAGSSEKELKAAITKLLNEPAH